MTRNKSILSHNSVLEHLHTFKQVPISIGCTLEDEKKDILIDQEWDICQDTGIIQLRDPLSLELVYKYPHNDAFGTSWDNHFRKFSSFISKYNPKNVLEIGGGSGKLSSLYVKRNPTCHWTMLEPNPQGYDLNPTKNQNIEIIQEWFTNDYKIKQNTDAIVHTHVLEHTYDPIDFLKTIYNKSNQNTKHIFSFPNLLESLKKYWTNCLSFEHTVFLTEEITDIVLQQSGFKILEKQYYEDHSIFYACEKSIPQQVEFPSSIYSTNKLIFLNYLKYHQNDIKNLNKKIEEFDGEVFLFGGHIFSQFLISNGLNTNKTKYILDNSSLKQNNRLYGTSFIVKSPQILKNHKKAAVILRAGTYSKEIKQDIINNINNKVIFF